MAPAFTIKEAKSIPQYLGIFEDIVAQWSDRLHGMTRPWCRGQASAAWGLCPGEYRPGVSLNADEIRSEFHLRALPLLQRLPSSDWEWYFLMQHYGLPTRLLDWTTGSLLGLYFAVRTDAGKEDAAVWVMDPWAFNKHTVGKSELFLATDKAMLQYLPKLYSKHMKLPDPPAAIVPSHNSDRITVQRGAFTVHGSSRCGIELMFTARLVKIVIPKTDAIAVKRALRMAGIGEFTVFRELDGLCREICAAEIEGC